MFIDFDIHRKSLRLEVVEIECQFSKGMYKIIIFITLFRFHHLNGETRRQAYSIMFAFPYPAIIQHNNVQKYPAFCFCFKSLVISTLCDNHILLVFFMNNSV